MPNDYAYHYRKFYGETDENFAEVAEQFSKKLRRLAVLKPGDKVLEVGCGWGFCLAGLSKLGITDVEGLDIDTFAIEKARKHGFTAHLLDIKSIPEFMANHTSTYDAVLAFDVIEHIPTDIVATSLRDIFLALKPGGIFICQVPNADSMVAAHMRYVDHTHHTAFTVTSLDAVLHNAGFDPANISDAEPIPARPSIREWDRLKEWIFLRFSRMLMRAVYVGEFGGYAGYRVPLDKNIIAITTRPAL